MIALLYCLLVCAKKFVSLFISANLVLSGPLALRAIPLWVPIRSHLPHLQIRIKINGGSITQVQETIEEPPSLSKLRKGTLSEV